MIDARLTIRSGTATRQVSLPDYLGADAEESAHQAEYEWIKGLRRLEVDGDTFRDRFTARGDSLWWFTELYLHKRQAVLDIHRAITAATALLDRESPAEVISCTGSPLVRHVVRQVAMGRRVRTPAAVSPAAWWRRLLALDARARTLTLSALATPERWRTADPGSDQARVAAFVHRAFWRPGIATGSAESYIGAILSELEARGGDVRYIGVGPARNFRAHRRLGSTRDTRALVPVERFAPVRALRESQDVWRKRYRYFRAMTRSAALRDAARIQGIDCWDILREEFAGVAWLQWPWSVRAMDEAAAALAACRPSAVVTYAEAGGWGRALILEARRRGIPSAGLQHGFIYRHWLNYRHEPDELQATRTPPFPYPTRTLLFDDYAARHLAEAGRLPASSLCVTGSPRLDALAADMFALSAEAIDEVRTRLHVTAGERLVLVTTKEKEARGVLRNFVEAAAGIPGVAVAIKPHPAETSAAYDAYLDDAKRITVVPPDAPLAPLLAAADAVVTVNSTVALDAARLDVPALVIGLPNNLSPFVDLGTLAGAADAASLETGLRRILYDERFREHLAARRRVVFGEPVKAHERRAGQRSAEAVLELIQPSREG
ncbi:MAG TPA: hypothetical protein VGD94_21430 [Vicinamibacterales bacterium]